MKKFVKQLFCEHHYILTNSMSGRNYDGTKTYWFVAECQRCKKITKIIFTDDKKMLDN